jgi:MFS family permease
MAEAGTTAEQAGRKPGMLALLKQADFRVLWLAQTVSWSGDHFTFLALMIVINKLTGSAGAVALLMMVMTVPRLLFGMAAGVFIDRWDRKMVMIVSNVALGVLSLTLIWVTASGQVWLFYPLAFIISSVGVFFMPARGAVMKTILKPEQLLPANILMQTTLTLTLVIGPALAGVTIGLFGTTPAFLFDGLTFFIAAALIVTMTVPRPAKTNGQGRGAGAFWSEFREGLAFVAATRTVLGLLLVLTVLSLATGAVNALFVPFMMNIIGVGATELGLVDSAQGLGMIAGAGMAAAIAARLRSNWIIAGGFGLASVLIIAIGMASTYQIVLLLMFLVGLIISPIQATIPALTQRIVPLEKMGRVGGTMNTSQSVATLASMGIAGIVAEIVGLRLVFVGAGVIGILASALAVSAIREE